MLVGAILATERETESPPDVIEYSKVTIAAAEQMDSLIRDLLDVTRIEAGRMSVEAEPTRVTEMLTDALGTFDAVAAAKAITLHLSADGSSTSAGRPRADQAGRLEPDREFGEVFAPRDVISIKAATRARRSWSQ